MPEKDERRQRIEAKLKEMSNDGVMPHPPLSVLSFDEPHEQVLKKSAPLAVAIEQEVLQSTTQQEAQESPRPEHESKPLMTIEDYRSLYFQPTRIREKTAFTMNVETLDMLRSVLQDLRERVSMASYLDNILREHLKSHRELLNQATAKQRRKTTITI